jgi:hypothetical protein
MADDGTTALDLYGLPQQEAAARLAARNAQLQQQSNMGVLGMLSGDPRLSAVGKTLQEQAYQARGENVGHTAEHVLEQTLKTQQEATQNELQRQKYKEELAQHADESTRRAQETALAWAQLKRGNRALDIEEADKAEQRRLEELKIGATKAKESKDDAENKKGLGVIDTAIDRVTDQPGAYSGKNQFLQSAGNIPGLGIAFKGLGQKNLKPEEKAARAAAEAALFENVHFLVGRLPAGVAAQLSQNLMPQPTDTQEDILAKLRNARTQRQMIAAQGPSVGATPTPLPGVAPTATPAVFGKYGGQ